MDRPTVREATGPHRRWLFWLWIALTVGGLAFLIVATPFAFMAPGNGAWMGYIVPPLMFVLLMAALGWLLWTVSARPTQRPPRERHRTMPHAAER